jgi:hypothetical protein
MRECDKIRVPSRRYWEVLLSSFPEIRRARWWNLSGNSGVMRSMRHVGRQAKVLGVVTETFEGFDGFYRREYGKAVRLAGLLTGSQPAAEDIVQDAMSAVYRAFESQSVPEAYLRRAVVNRAHSWLRDERRRRARRSGWGRSSRWRTGSIVM